MPRRVIPLMPGVIYHIYNRGHNRSNIFFSESNYIFFLRRLRQYILPEAKIIAYVLMPNHYHLLVEILAVNFSHAMQNFAISYTKAINQRFSRTGSVFQGAFKSKPVEKNEVLLHLSKYIHLNPLKANLVKQLEDWPFSSYPEYIGTRDGRLPDPGLILEQFASNESDARFRYKEFVDDGAAKLKLLSAELKMD